MRACRVKRMCHTDKNLNVVAPDGPELPVNTTENRKCVKAIRKYLGICAGIPEVVDNEGEGVHIARRLPS